MLLGKVKWIAGLALIAGAAGTGAIVLSRPNGERVGPWHVAQVKREVEAPIRRGLARKDELRPPSKSTATAPASPAELPSETSSAVSRFVEQLKKHPATPSPAAERNGLYLLDVNRGDVTLIAEEPAPGLTHCGSAWWSTDGSRIVFDATPKAEWTLSRIQSIALVDGRLVRSDLGPGNCPSVSPDGKQIAFLLNSGAAPDAESGVWLMNSDGSQRRRLGGYGRVKWAPDGRQLLLISFGIPPKPVTLSLLDIETDRVQPLAIPGHQVFSVPSWAGDGTLAAVIGAGDFAESIALVDVHNPDEAKATDVLWMQTSNPALTPSYPVYSPVTERCIFVGEKRKEPALYSVEHGQSARPRRLEAAGFDRVITDLAGSPDGRYMIFCSDRPRQTRKPGPTR